MRLLVTGAAGLLGRVAVHDNAGRHEVVAMVHRRALPEPDVESVSADLEDLDTLDRAWDTARPDLVLHAGAIAEIEACERDPARAERVNVDATAHLARLGARDGVRMVHLSTDAVFDGTAGPYQESDVPCPQSVYAATKLAAEAACLEVLPTALVARVNFFGWSATGTRSLAEFFHGALSAGREVRGFTDVEFTSLYNRDLVDLLLDASAAELSGIFHVGSADRMSKFDFGRALAAEFSLDPDLVTPGSLADLGAEVRRSARLSMDSSAFETALRRPLPTFAQGLERMRKDGESGYADRIRATGGSQDREITR